MDRQVVDSSTNFHASVLVPHYRPEQRRMVERKALKVEEGVKSPPGIEELQVPR